MINKPGRLLYLENAARKILLIFLSVSLMACTVGPEVQPDDPEFAPIIAHADNKNKSNPGGVYKQGYGMALFSDRRAARVGDIITIILSEATVASKSGSATMDKDSSLAFDTPTILNTTPSLGELGFNTSLSQSRDFAGASGANQSNSLTGQISVTVSEVLPNGLLVVRGEKWLTLNKGKEYIRIRGIIRQEDISPDNVIASNKLADARITYSGTGDLAAVNEIGWISKIFNSRFWPF